MQGDAGDHARRSIVRRAYLYLALFAGVVGGMASAVALLYTLLKVLLTGGTDSTFQFSILNDLQLLVLFALLLIYHLSVLRGDGDAAADALAQQQAAFKVLVVDAGGKLGEAVKAALAKAAPNVPVVVSPGRQAGQFDAVVISGSQAMDSQDWLRSFKGSRIIIPDEAPGVIWADGVSEDSVQHAAQAVRQLAEGQPVRQRGAGSGWRVVVYIAAALFGLQLLFVIVALAISAFVG